MFKKCIKNYFHSLRYVLVILGAMFLTLMIGISIFINGSKNAISNMTDSVKTITHDTDLSFDEVKEALKDTFGVKDDVSLTTGAEDVVTHDISTALENVVTNYTTYAAEVVETVAIAVGKILLYIGFFFFIQILGLIFGHDLTYYFVRYDIKSRNIFAVILERLFRSIVVFLYLLFMVFVLMKLPIVGFILVLIYPFVYCIWSLLCAWVTGGKKRPSFKSVVNFPNIFALFFGNLVAIVITIILGIVIGFVFNGIVAVLIMIALFVVASVANTLNASLFVFDLAEESENEESEIEESEIEESVGEELGIAESEIVESENTEPENTEPNNTDTAIENSEGENK